MKINVIITFIISLMFISCSTNNNSTTEDEGKFSMIEANFDYSDGELGELHFRQNSLDMSFPYDGRWTWMDELIVGNTYTLKYTTDKDVNGNPHFNLVFIQTKEGKILFDKTETKNNDLVKEEDTEKPEFSNGILKIKNQGKTLLVHQPYSITHFCTANFEKPNISGYSDWRLPTPEELKLIYKYRELIGLNTNSSMNAYDVSDLLGKGRTHPVNEVWSSEYNEDKIKKTEQEYKHHYGGGGDYYDKTSEKTLYNVTTLNIITGEIKTHNGCECGSVGDDAIWIPVRSGN